MFNSRPWLILDIDHTLIETKKRTIPTLAVEKNSHNPALPLPPKCTFVDCKQIDTKSPSLPQIPKLPQPLLQENCVSGTTQKASAATQKEVFDFKLRPRLAEFLREVCQIFNLVIYTMSMRYYAEAIVDLLDPTGTRLSKEMPYLVCRDDFPNHIEKALANLSLPPGIDLIILDDRLDIWSQVDRKYVLQITPFIFFNPVPYSASAAADDGLSQALLSLKLIQRHRFRRILCDYTFLILDFNISVHLPVSNQLHFDHTVRSKAFHNWAYLMRYFGAKMSFLSQFIDPDNAADQDSVLSSEQLDYNKLPYGITHVISLQPRRVIDCLFYQHLQKHLQPSATIVSLASHVALASCFPRKRKLLR